MGDDPLIPGVNVERGSSNASGNHQYFISNIGKPSFTILVVTSGLALGLAISSAVFMGLESRHNEQESQRVIDQLKINEREVRMAEYYINILNQTLAEQNIKFPRYEEFKQQHKE